MYDFREISPVRNQFGKIEIFYLLLNTMTDKNETLPAGMPFCVLNTAPGDLEPGTVAIRAVCERGLVMSKAGDYIVDNAVLEILGETFYFVKITTANTEPTFLSFGGEKEVAWKAYESLIEVYRKAGNQFNFVIELMEKVSRSIPTTPEVIASWNGVLLRPPLHPYAARMQSEFSQVLNTETRMYLD